MVETPEEFEERMDEIAEITNLTREMEASILSNMKAITEGIKTHFDLTNRLTELVGG